jgi:DNA-binding response OmpR family regulator
MTPAAQPVPPADPGAAAFVGARILLVEDEPRVADFVMRGLRAEGYEVELARTGPEGLERARAGGHAAILLDLMLPGLDGRALCRALRHDGDTTPVLMLTALDSVTDKVEGFALGADDYLPKPFAFEELLARLGALIRRSRIVPAPGARRNAVIAAAGIELDRDSLTAIRGGRRVELTAKEMALLEILMSSPGQAVSRERILAHVWNLAEDPMTNVVDVYVHRLRRKLEDAGGRPAIATVRGHGYRLLDERDRG